MSLGLVIVSVDHEVRLAGASPPLNSSGRRRLPER